MPVTEPKHSVYNTENIPIYKITDSRYALNTSAKCTKGMFNNSSIDTQRRTNKYVLLVFHQIVPIINRIPYTVVKQKLNHSLNVLAH